MSEKETVIFGDNFHVYRNVFDENKGVYLRLYSSTEFTIEKGAGYNMLTVLIDESVWKEFKKKIKSSS